MERLTYVTEEGEVLFHPAELPDDEGVTITQLAKAGRYKELKQIAERLANREQAEENGLLLRLPCKVGDTVYRIDTDTSVISEIEPCHIDNIIICNDGEVLLKYDAYDGVICSIDNLVNGTPYLDYYMMYLSLEEAEAKLAEMEDGHE